MKEVMFKVQARKEAGKEKTKKIRAQGLLPGVVYGEGKSTPVVFNAHEFENLYHSIRGENVLINLEIVNGGKETKKTLIREIQREPVWGKILHVDFQHVSLAKKISVKVPVHLVGTPPVGVKETGGILQHTFRELEISCLPTEIPQHIDVDVSLLKIGDSVHVRDLKLAEGIQILVDPDLSVASVVPPTIIKEGELEAAAEVAEPEVITERKPEEGEEAEEGAEAKGKEKKPAAEAKGEKKPAEPAKTEKKEEKKPEKK
ncbi:MAG: 50S ribosomal protein L25 [candidate division Zixibacteria bacterium]|nr:50S ribosomal protein L25 [candidate division Zixibacteria bacterium]